MRGANARATIVGSARTAILVASGVAASCASKAPLPATTEWSLPNAMWCADMPYPLEGRYSDGSLLVRARKLETSSGLIEWTYFDPQGARELVEVQAPDGSFILTAYHPNGQKHFEGGFLYDHGRSEYWGAGPWEFFRDDGKVEASVELAGGKPVPGTTHAWDKSGKETDWSLADDAFRHYKYQVLFAQVSYPPEAARIRGLAREACDLVCIDDTGKVTGFFPMNSLGFGLDEALLKSLKHSTFTPRRVGEIPLPICFQLHFRFSGRPPA